jgi:hypothetical protein
MIDQLLALAKRDTASPFVFFENATCDFGCMADTAQRGASSRNRCVMWRRKDAIAHQVHHHIPSQGTLSPLTQEQKQ